ncbi:MAG: DUF4199 domain-containing protein [Bacteroidetes bacterium]|nr:MAG: DUF4199 domain-containing protein [Bacteroidota bacterium]MBL1143762.1 DUF4199 domain-containing protein [Bacteroidota bacterium]MCB0802613.1 DUF4199 domain-containing protein [Flavobacteriales bacterium]NOG56563.1 DUF4199 domain-containing protein [Bacteroidota bacterium]
MKNSVFKYGIIGGLIVSLFMCATLPFMDKNTDFANSELLGYATMLVSYTSLFFGVKSYRNNKLNGVISFKKAFMVGLYIALVISSMYVLTWLILSNYFLPNFAIDYFNSSIEALNNSGLSQAEIDAQIQTMNVWMEYYKNPLFKAALTYLEILPLGILVTLFSAAILKKEE